MERRVAAEGTIQRAGISIYMEGTHQLVTAEGQIVLLQSAVINLDDYLDERVAVTGVARPTVEAGGTIVDVETVERLEPDVLVESSSSSSSESSLSSVASVSSVTVISSVSSSRSSSSSKSSSSSSAAVSSIMSSIQASASSSSASSTDRTAAVTAMARVAGDTASYNQKYCTSHIGFCVPIHKYWFYQSFGANVSPALWQVEIGNSEISVAGDGIILVRLMSGSLPAGESEGTAVVDGSNAVAKRQWTGGRHFEVFGPAELKAAVEFMANGIEVYQTEQ